MSTLSNERRRQIASFLRSRRARVQPEDVGLVRGARRRTPGLRREEVAALAEVSTEWYKWLEQSRDVRASADVLRRIAGALRLEPGESHHLLRLSGYSVANAAAHHPAEVDVGPHLQRLLDELTHCPAWVQGARWDILAWNAAARLVFGDLGAMEGIERNAIYALFMNEQVRRSLADWERHAQGCVGMLHGKYAEAVDDPWFNQLIEALRQHSPEFAAWWGNQEIQAYEDGTKHYEHPEVGRLSFEYTVLNVADQRYAALSLVTYVPMDGTDTRDKIDRLLCQA